MQRLPEFVKNEVGLLEVYLVLRRLEMGAAASMMRRVV